MANDDFFAGLDEAEAQAQVQLEAKQGRVRYWYEEGYVPGNEKDSDEESTSNESDRDGDERDKEREKVSAWDADAPAFLAADRPGQPPGACRRKPQQRAGADSGGEGSGSDRYEDVVPCSRGGRRVVWGGVHGKLCLADGDADEVPALSDVLDELLLPAADSASTIGGSSSSAAPPGEAGVLALARTDEEPEPEVAAVLMSQVAGDAGKSARWSHGLLWESQAVSVAVDAAKVREKFAHQDGFENPQVRSVAEPTLTQLAIGNHLLRKQERQEWLAKCGKEELEAKQVTTSRGSCERLPGTRKPLALSQAWQERHPLRHQALEVKPRRGSSMLPGCLTKPEPAPGPLQVTPGPEFSLRSSDTGHLVHTGPLPPVVEEPLFRHRLEGPLPAAEDFCRISQADLSDARL